MHRRRFVIQFGWLIATAMLCSPGCALVRGWMAPHKPPADKKQDATATDEKKTATPAELAAIMNEVQQLGSLDPAAQNALLEDLKRTDPALWPQLVQTFRASIAYRRRVEERTRLAAAANANGIRQAGFNANGTQSLPATADGASAPKAPSPDFAKDYPDTKMPPVRLAGATAPVETSGDWRTQLASLARNLESQQATSGTVPGTAPAPPARRQCG